MVYLNFQTSVGETIATPTYNKMMELGMSYASDMIREAAYNGHRAGFASNPVTVDGEDALRFPIESGDAHLVEILKQLAKVRNRAGISFHSIIEQDIKNGLSETEIYVLTPFIDADMERLFYSLRMLENTVCVVNLSEHISNLREKEDFEARMKWYRGDDLKEKNGKGQNKPKKRIKR